MTRKKRPNQCSECGQPASGNFCPNCGVALKGARCPKCDSRLPSGSRFCSSCGHAPGATRKGGSRWPAIVFAAAVVALLVIVMVTAGPFGPDLSTDRTPPGAQPVNPDLSGLAAGTPRAQADRFFALAMRSHESGDSTQAAYAGGMALGAYSRLPEGDADMRLHVGLLHEINGDYDAVLAQADSLERSYPDHLFAYLLRDRARAQSGDAGAANEIYRRFLEVYDVEIAKSKQEYEAHARLIDGFRNRALQAVGN